ncbi:MAG: hypothetical protein B6226_03105 [Candidatus Cloacimonetes bacterium 4572_65]|nr:MAG: hypothetical protein B6226_03105 [Candidatus Cloacimonetes bacterium 4572_65]
MKVEVSIGEVVDKVTILSIKVEKFQNEAKRANAKKEYDALVLDIIAIGITPELDEYKRLRAINVVLWNIEDSIRVKEKNGEFDDEFIRLARSVYFENDTRAEIKKEINIKYASDFVEEKEYVDYKG